MIISNDLRHVFVSVPKTGTQSASSILAELGTPLVEARRGGHPIPERLDGLLALNELSPGEPPLLYGFWRDPVERFVSAAEFYKRCLPAAVMSLLSDRFRDVPRPAEWFYPDGAGVPESVVEAVAEVTAADILAALPTGGPTQHGLFQPQAHWLSGGVRALPFADFEAQLRQLVVLFGGDPDVSVPHLNAATQEPPALNAATVKAIKRRYAADYQIVLDPLSSE